MTNPDKIVRVRARNGGRASVYEANALAQPFESGLLAGQGVLQNTVPDSNVLVGGTASRPDVVIAATPSGFKVALDIVGQEAVAITAPAENSRVSSIVIYTDDISLQSTDSDTTGSPSSCGLLVVNGDASAEAPQPPSDEQIRQAITTDGATGTLAAYAIIANITVSTGAEIITNDMIKIVNADINAKAAIEVRDSKPDKLNPFQFVVVPD